MDEKTCPAFTLIEFLIVASLIGILLTIGIAQYMNFNRSQILTQTAEDLKNNLKFAQSKALSGEKPQECAVLDGYQVRFISQDSGDSYEIQGICGGAPIGEIKTFSLPAGVKFSSPPSPILFKVLGHGTNLESALTIILTGFGQTRTVKVSKTGEIR